MADGRDDRAMDVLETGVGNSLSRIARELEAESFPGWSQGALNKMMDHAWPGNVRELENIVARAAAMCEENQITPVDLGLTNGSQKKPTPQSALTGELAQLERERIEQALADNRYNKTAAAKQLGISFRALRYRLKKLGIE